MDLATAAFWLFLAVIAGSLIWRKTILRRETLATLRVAIERGLPLEDRLVQALLDAGSGRRARSPIVSRDFFLVLGALVRLRQAWVRGLLRRWSQDPALADDLAQEDFVQAWKQLPRLRAHGALSRAAVRRFAHRF